MLPALLFLLAVGCAFTIGFAAHRASLCNVRAVAEVLSSGTAHMLASLMQAVLWAAILSGSLVVVLGQKLPGIAMPDPGLWSLAGAWLFGVGAGINGGCSLSTLHRLADGELGMLATVSGFLIGTSAWFVVLPAFPAAPVYLPVEPAWARWPAAAPWLLALAAPWAVHRLFVLRRLLQGNRRRAWMEVARTPRYPFAVAAALMGLSAGLLYATQGSWSYTGAIRTAVASAGAQEAMPGIMHALLVVALLGGMWVSAATRGPLTWKRPQRRADWLRHGAAGALMGLGAALVPGGNDTLLLAALPTLTLQAAAAYLSMLAGIATVWWLMQLAHVPMSPVMCTPEGCRDDSTSLPN